jgi:acetyl-CoA C-acetyltransferase
MRRVAILGGGIYRPDRVRLDVAEEGVAMAYRQLLKDVPNLDPMDIEFVQSSYFSDHLNQQLCMAWIVQDYIGLHRKGGFRVEAGGSTPLDAIINAYYLIQSGHYDLILVLGWEWMSEVDTATTNEFIASASDTDWDFTVGGFYNGYYAALETRHMQLYGETIEDLGRIAVKNRNNAVHNPYSQWRSEHGTSYVTIEDYYKDRIIAWPYRRWNCALISEGACCILMGSDRVAARYSDHPMWIAGVGLGTDSMRPGDRLVNWAYQGAFKAEERIYPQEFPKPITPYPEMANFGFAREAAKQAYAQAGIADPVKQIDFCELFAPYDGVELCLYEDLMFCPRGEGKTLVRQGVTERGGELPCQLSGGLTAFAHPVGATSLYQALFCFWQLAGRIPEKFGDPTLQLSNPRRALMTGHGGTGCQGGVIIYSKD